MGLNNIYDFIKEIVEEELDDLDETTLTGDIEGYNTPFAFGGGRESDKKKRKKYSTTSTGYKIVKELVKEILTDFRRK